MLPPEGSRDLLFDAARRLRACETALARVFEDAGFDEVVPPLLERAELFDAGRAVRAYDAGGRVLAVRADFTAQTARIAASRLADRASLRLWYRGSVVRDAESPRHAAAARELRQAGCEIVGDGTPEADAEALALASRALHALGLSHARLSVGSVAYFQACLDEVRVDEAAAAALRDAVDRKDRAGLAALAEALPERVREALAFLAAPVAGSLDRARELAPNNAAHAAVARLSGALAAARERGLAPELEVDLGEVRGMGYYTGLVFNAYAEGAAGALGGGGRYDGLLGRFGDPRPAVGFSLDLDAIVPLATPSV